MTCTEHAGLCHSYHLSACLSRNKRVRLNHDLLLYVAHMKDSLHLEQMEKAAGGQT